MSGSPRSPSLLALEVANLRVGFPGPAGPLTIIDDISFTIRCGQRFGLVGESGSGKSITMLSILGLVDPPGFVTADTLCIDGQRVDPGKPESYRGVRGRAAALVMQDPRTALSPVFSIGDQLRETIRNRFAVGRREATAEAEVLLDAVGIPDPAIRMRDYPHQLSGGMRQRVAIALALACQPSLLIADEPTTALDATIRAQVMELLLQLADERDMAIALITHDFGLLAGFATEVAVMYAGRIVERGAVDDIFAQSAHPYTRALLAAQPRIEGARRERFPAISGQPPDPARRPSGCPFHPRCLLSRGRLRCAQETPLLRPIGPTGQLAACHFAEEVHLETPGLVGAASG